MSLTCVSCNQLIANNDWSQKNVKETSRGLMHKQCKSNTNTRTFQYKHDFDQNGILYWLGTNKGITLYSNPAITHNIHVISSSFHNDSDHANMLTGRENVKCFTQDQQNSWFMIDLKNTKVIPTQYTLKYSPAQNVAMVGAPRCWTLYASNNSTDGSDGDWDILLQHINDTKLDERGASFTWVIPQKNNQSYSQYKIRQFNRNSNDSHILALSFFELYGTVMSDKSVKANNTELIQVDVDENKINAPEQLVNEHKMDEEGKLINNLISENDRIKREFDEYKQMAKGKEKSLVDVLFKNSKNKEENGKVKQEYDEYKQVCEATQKSLNVKIIEKDNDIKQLQASLFSSYSQNKELSKEYEIQLRQTEQLMIALRDENEQLRVQLRQLQSIVKEEEKKEDLKVDKCKWKFQNWLCNVVKLPQYLAAFKQNEYDDIRMIEYLDENTMRNEIGVKNLHCRLLLRKVIEFKQLQMGFEQLFNTHESLKQFKQTFEMDGILTLQELKNNIKNKKDLERLLDINDENMINLVWSAVYQQIPQRQVNEGNATAYI